MATWITDPMHTEIGFKVRHLVISNVSGKFDQFEATVTSEKEDFTDAAIQFHANIGSVNTGNAQRDAHLKSPDFFDADNHPQLSFVSNGLTHTSGNAYELAGDLTIRGVTQPIRLQVEFGGVGPNGYGQTIAGFELNGKINRKDFGLNWNSVTEAGGIVVSDEVKIHINAELIQQA